MTQKGNANGGRSLREEITPSICRNKQPGRTNEEDVRQVLMASLGASRSAGGSGEHHLVSPHAACVTGAEYVIDGTVPTWPDW